MIDINVDQPDVLVIVSNSIPKANFVLDISSTVGYNKVTSCVPGTTDPITNPLDYDNLVIDNIIQHISDNIDKNVAVAFMLPQVPAFVNNIAKGIISIAQDRFKNQFKNEEYEQDDIYIKFVYVQQPDLKKDPIVKRIKYFNDKLEAVVVQTSL